MDYGYIYINNNNTVFMYNSVWSAILDTMSFDKHILPQ